MANRRSEAIALLDSLGAEVTTSNVGKVMASYGRVVEISRQEVVGEGRPMFSPLSPPRVQR